MVVPSHAAPLSSTSSSLLLAQVCNELGTGDWAAVAARLVQSELLDDQDDPVDAKSCETAFAKLLAAEGLAAPTAPNARSTRTLIHKLYAELLKERYDAVVYSFTQERHLLSLIDSLSSAATPDSALLEALPADLRARVDAATAAEEEEGPASSTRGRKSPRKARAEAETEQQQPDGEGADDTSGAEEEVLESLRGATSRQKEKTVKAEPTSEIDSEAEEPRSTRRGRSKAAAGATASPRKSSRARRGATEDEGTPAEEEGTPAEGDEDEEGEGDEDGEEEGRRSGRRRGAPPVAGARAKRTSKRRLTSEPFSPPSSVAGDGESRPSGRQSKRVKTEGEVLAADGARFRKSILLLLSRLDDLPSSSLFRHPVRKGDAPSYSMAVKRPMWLAQITSRVKKGLTQNAEELMRDVALLCADAVQFNGTEDNVGQKARELWSVFEGMMEEYLTRNQQED